MRENEIHIHKGEEGKVGKKERKTVEPRKQKGWRERGRYREGKEW